MTCEYRSNEKSEGLFKDGARTGLGDGDACCFGTPGMVK